MKIQQLDLQNFMIFDQLGMTFSPDINIFCGENSTGKTALLKLLYTCAKTSGKLQNAKGDITKEQIESELVSKLQGVFRPNKDSVGRLVHRGQKDAKASVSVMFDQENQWKFSFGKRQEKHADIASSFIPPSSVDVVYIPPKEFISSTENFASLYADYHIAFEETYYDLARLLERPLKKGINSESHAILKSFEKILNGCIIQRDKTFFFQEKDGSEYEMGLLSEGYRKLATIMYLVQTGSLSKGAILFWDEPETNMNPKMIQPLVEAIIELANLGVQVFVTTHDYFVQQCFDLAAMYPTSESPPLKYQFVSLYKSERKIEVESADRLTGLTHNVIMEEFDQLYDREQRLLYERD